MNKNNFSKNLIKIRKNKSLSQRDLAIKTGISQRVIAHYETNAINPSLTKIQKIAKVLEISPAELLKDNNSYSNKNEFEILDIKTLKRLKQIANLTPQERNTIYTLLDAILEKRKKKQKQLVESKK